MVVIEPSRMPASVQPEINRPGSAELPTEVEMILSAIEAGQFTPRERRCAPRTAYRAQATLRLFSDTAETPPWVLYTRDSCARGLGFITPHRLPLGYGGLLNIVGPTGENRSISCTLLRCREAAPGWYEGSLYFNRKQPEFGA